MIHIDGHKRYLPPPPGRTTSADETSIPLKEVESQYSTGRFRGKSDDLHEWSIYRQNINAGYVDYALRNKKTKPYPYGEFRLDPSTVSTLIYHQKVDSKLAVTTDDVVDANMLINFGLPRPTMTKDRFYSWEVMQGKPDDTNLRRARSHPENVTYGGDYVRTHSRMTSHSQTYDPRRTQPSPRPRSRSVDDLLDRPEDYKGRHSPGERLTQSAYGGFNEDKRRGGHRNDERYDYRQEAWQRSNRRDSPEVNYRSTANLISNAEPMHSKPDGGIDHVDYRHEWAIRSTTPTKGVMPLPIGRMYARNDWIWDRYGRYDTFDIGEVPEPMLTQYPHLQLREVTTELHTTTCCCCCKKKRINRILDGITCELHGGEMLAILGSAKCGKTSILNLLAGYRASGLKYYGEIYLNGNIMQLKQLRHIVAYVKKSDYLIPYLTVQQFLTLFAKLKYCKNSSSKERTEAVTFFMQSARLDEVKNAKISTLKLEHKKLISIVCQLMLNTDILLLDEPTTGLDTYWSMFITDYIRDYVDRGRIAIMTVVQPNIEMFRKFTTVSVISEGKICYFGTNRNMVPYFTSLQYPLPPLTNPCDYYVDLVTIDYESLTTTEESLERVKKLADVHRQRSEPLSHPGPPQKLPPNYFMANCFKQFFALCKLMSRRVFSMQTVWIFLTVALMSLLIGLIYSNIDLLVWGYEFPSVSQVSIDGRFGFGFTMIAIGLIPEMYRIIGQVDEERPGLYAGLKLKIFHTVPYYSAKILLDLFPFILTAIVFATPAYWLSNYQRSGLNYGYFLAVMIMYLYSIRMLTYAVAYMFNRSGYAARAVFLALAYVTVAAGFAVHHDHMFQVFQWEANSSSAQWAYRLILQNEFIDLNCHEESNITILDDQIQPIELLQTYRVCDPWDGEHELTWLAKQYVFLEFIPWVIMASFALFFLIAGCFTVCIFTQKPPNRDKVYYSSRY